MTTEEPYNLNSPFHNFVCPIILFKTPTSTTKDPCNCCSNSSKHAFHCVVISMNNAFEQIASKDQILWNFSPRFLWFGSHRCSVAFLILMLLPFGLSPIRSGSVGPSLLLAMSPIFLWQLKCIETRSLNILQRPTSMPGNA